MDYKKPTSTRPSRGRQQQNSSNLYNQSDTKRVPMLTWHNNTTKCNSLDWKEKIINHASLNFRYIPIMLETEASITVKEVRVPDPDENGEYSELDKILYSSDLARYRDTLDDINREIIPFFTFMMNHISESSKTILMRDDEYEDHVAKKNIVDFWKLIKSTHSGKGPSLGSGFIPGEIDRELLENLESVAMGENENLSTYVKRFNNALKAYDGTDIDVPNVSLQVALFIRNLCDIRFKQFKITLRSDFHQLNVPYPKTINAAFTRAADWENDHPVPYRSSKPSHQSSTSFHASTSQSHDDSSKGRGRERGGRGREGGRGRGRGRDHTPQSSKGERYVCDLCGTLGHYTNHCPRLADAKTAINNGQSFHTSVEAHDINRPSKDDILLDTQCSHYIFRNPDLLHHLHTSPITITVHGQVEKASFSTNKAGYFMDLEEEVYYSHEARANLLSFSKVWNQFDITTNPEEKTLTVILSKNHSMTFRQSTISSSVMSRKTSPPILNHSLPPSSSTSPDTPPPM